MQLAVLSGETGSLRKGCFAVLLIAIVLLAHGCASGQTGGETALEETGRADMHAISSERLKVVMQNLKSLTFNRYESALELEKERSRYFREMASIAEAVGRSAESVSMMGDRLRLNKSEQKEFLRLAGRLRKQAAGIRQQADSGRRSGLQEKMRNMIATCNSCHDRFRNMGGMR